MAIPQGLANRCDFAISFAFYTAGWETSLSQIHLVSLSIVFATGLSSSAIFARTLQIMFHAQPFSVQGNPCAGLCHHRLVFLRSPLPIALLARDGGAAVNSNMTRE